MEVRLAHEQGLLHKPDLNHFQHWALMYWVYLDQRTQNETLRDQLEIQTFNLFPDRWVQLYQGRADSILTPAPDEDQESPVDDIDEINAWYEQMEQQRFMSGAGSHSGTQPPEEWGEWT